MKAQSVLYFVIIVTVGYTQTQTDRGGEISNPSDNSTTKILLVTSNETTEFPLHTHPNRRGRSLKKIFKTIANEAGKEAGTGIAEGLVNAAVEAVKDAAISTSCVLNSNLALLTGLSLAQHSVHHTW